MIQVDNKAEGGMRAAVSPHFAFENRMMKKGRGSSGIIFRKN
ncbi:hypothetical protein [Virgibacillus pantothenticus]|nr:hypothetical protein [Virgibacillus pantothenticus]